MSLSPDQSCTNGHGRRYVPLFNVSFRHGYYNNTGLSCPDLKAVPTPDCARLMASLRIIFQDLGTGFTVHIEQAAIPALIAYIQRQHRTDAPGAGYWTWLSFILVATNPGLVGITRLPIDTNMMSRNLYVSNLAVASGAEGLEFQQVSGPDACLLPLSGNGVTVATPSGASGMLTDIGGAVVPAVSTSSGGETCFAMRNLPYGCYTAGTAMAGGAFAAGQRYLYLPTQPQPFGLMNLLLAQPACDEGVATAFPVAIPPPPATGVTPSPPAVSAVDLALALQPRQTYWNYYICSQDKTAQFGSGLRIRGKGTHFDTSKVRLPNGDPAILFAARQPLPLQQLSEYHFSLSGHRKGAAGGSSDISVPRLPASAAMPVWPAPAGDALAGLSEIYVYV